MFWYPTSTCEKIETLMFPMWATFTDSSSLPTELEEWRQLASLKKANIWLSCNFPSWVLLVDDFFWIPSRLELQPLKQNRHPFVHHLFDLRGYCTLYLWRKLDLRNRQNWIDLCISHGLCPDAIFSFSSIR
jgi:hypothetical protein